ncbi:hypothetical protein [Methylobacterium sp. 77]|uniref:hypothetical protein n=1 Tax=Methylobacterium sp. 77 TaxID=1101192 RepID=UPI0012DD8BDF|nr:hypothetical protein [Methylobacterium sp. 77]
MDAETKLIRLRQSLNRKYDPGQPRAPSGQSDGGQWISGGGGAADNAINRFAQNAGRWSSLNGESAPGAAVQETIVGDEGARVLSLRIRSRRGEWEDQHTVITSDGESRIFENSGETQTIRDGHSGEVLSSSTFSTSESQSDATIQSAFLPVLSAAASAATAATIEAAALLFTYLAARDTGYGKAPGRTAFRYDFDPDPNKKFPLIWVGQIHQSQLNQACPRNNEVQAITDEATKRLTALNPQLSKQQLGNLIHYDIATTIKALGYPDLQVEFSLDISGIPAKYGTQNSSRLDLFELTPDRMVCVYDYKTGNKGLSPTRALALARVAKMYYPQSIGIVIIQVKPQL